MQTRSALAIDPQTGDAFMNKAPGEMDAGMNASRVRIEARDTNLEDADVVSLLTRASMPRDHGVPGSRLGQSSDRPQSDQQQLDALMRAFYEVISFEEGSAPDWDSMASLFSRHARITRVTPEATDYMDLSSFKNMVEELLELGAFTSFFEREIRRRTDRFGSVIHVASAYETRVSPTALDYVERGVNSLQLIQEDERWKIISLCWDSNAPFSVTAWQSSVQGGSDGSN